jgi:DNA-binding GntR family transcriptional regulator
MPVREAINKLAFQKIVNIKPRFGCQVVVPSKEDRLMMVEARILMEKYAIEKYLESPDKEILLNLQPIVKEMKKIIAMEDFSSYKEEFLNLDLKFHQKLILLSKNNFIISKFEEILIHMNMEYTYRVFGYKLSRKKMQDHVKIYTALENNSKSAVGLIKGHLKELQLELL